MKVCVKCKIEKTLFDFNKNKSKTMRSKVAQRILAETPEETKIFARLYADIVVLVNQLLKAKGFSQKDLADKLEKKSLQTIK